MKVGVPVICVVCGDMKKPVGRSGPLGMSFCEDAFDGHGCVGYRQDPQPGTLWPGESDEDFGYPVGPYGWKWVESDKDYAAREGEGAIGRWRRC